MQSFIVNVPEDKVAFFVELIEQLNFELLDIDEQENAPNLPSAQADSDPFLDWEEERKNAKRK